ncbi:MAG: SpoVR family protein [Candidatus Cyclobacteriaceae bacterium M3_2C_046]
MADWTIDELRKWNTKIEKLADQLGLDFYPQEFEICDYHDMLGYQSYSGMPSRYPHWSFGKSFEKQRTLYQHGLSGLAYEMVINSNPCLAYLMIDNPLAMQILTMAHVYGHNDFFKNNIHFSKTRAELSLEMFKRHADRVRDYVERPGIGYEKVEKILDAAHAVRFQCNRNIFIKSLSEKEQEENFFKGLNRPPGPWEHLHSRTEKLESDFMPEPIDDLILFIRDNQPFLSDWQKDLLTIVHNETKYFLPQMETKIMNEGWATFWHYTILNQLDLTPHHYMDFIRSHNQVVRPHVGGLNPYHIGYVLFMKISGSDGHQISYNIDPEIFTIRKVDRDSSFLRRYLTRELAQELNLFEYQVKHKKAIISEVSDQKGWEKIRETLISNIGMNGIPVIKVKDINRRFNQLRLIHEYDNRELDLQYVEKTLQHVYNLWNSPVLLETVIDKAPVYCTYDEGKFLIEKIH